MMTRTLLLISVMVSGLIIAPSLAQVNTAPPANIDPNVTRPNSFANLADKLLPTVVNISSTGRSLADDAPYGTPEQLAPDAPQSPFDHFFDDYANRQSDSSDMADASLGSGFIIDAAEGFIVTNNHVIAGSTDIRITLSDDRSYKASIVGVDEKTDIALLKIDPSGKPLIAVKFGNSDTLRVGDWILAIGNPFGLGGTVTAGIVSARSRDINAGPYDDFIQTDASINRGNSGGPMFNTKGELIGINTAIFSPSGGSIGIGFAIPINMIQSVIDQLKEFGEVRRGWLGVKIQSITPEIAEAIGLENDKGALVADVIGDGPAFKAGLQPYDVLLSFNGQAINTMRDLPIIVAKAKVDTPIPVKVFRDNKIVEATITLEVAKKTDIKETLDSAPSGLEEEFDSMPQDQNNAEQSMISPIDKADISGDYIAKMNIKLSPITRDLSALYGLIENMSGLVITHVDANSDAAIKDLRPGDVILEIDREKIVSMEQVNAALNLALTKKRTSLLLLVDRNGEEVFAALKLDLPQKKSKKSNR